MVYRLVYRTTNGDLLPVARVLHAETSNGDNVSCEQSSIYATNSRYVDPQATPLPSAPIQHRYQTQSPARNQQPFAQLGTSSSLPLPATESLAVSMDSWFQGLPFNNDLPYYNHNNDLQSGHDASKLAQETSIYPASPLERRRSNAFGATNDPDLQLSATRQSYQGGQPISQAPLSQPALGWPAAARFPNQTPYSEVIWNCLKESPEYTCSLKDIYEYFTQHTDRDQLARQTAKGDDKVYKKERAGWQCSVRHNLSMNEGFASLGRGMWALLPNYINGIESTTRFRKDKKSRSSSPDGSSYETTRDRRRAAGRKGGEASRHDRKLRRRATSASFIAQAEPFDQMALPDASSYDLSAFSDVGMGCYTSSSFGTPQMSSCASTPSFGSPYAPIHTIPGQQSYTSAPTHFNSGFDTSNNYGYPSPAMPTNNVPITTSPDFSYSDHLGNTITTPGITTSPDIFNNINVPYSTYSSIPDMPNTYQPAYPTTPASSLRLPATPYAPRTPSRLAREISPFVLDPALEDGTVGAAANVTGAGGDVASTAVFGANEGPMEQEVQGGQMGMCASRTMDVDVDFPLDMAAMGGWGMTDFEGGDFGLGGDVGYDFGL